MFVVEMYYSTAVKKVCLHWGTWELYCYFERYCNFNRFNFFVTKLQVTIVKFKEKVNVLRCAKSYQQQKEKEVKKHTENFFLVGQRQASMARSPKGDDAIEVVPGKRKDTQSYYFNNHFYIVDKALAGVIYLRCTNYRVRNVQCRNRGKLKDGKFIQTSVAEHTCVDNKESLQIRKLKHRMKEESESLGKTLHDIYKDVITGQPDKITDNLDYRTIRPAMYHSRRRKWPTWVKTVTDIIDYYEGGGEEEDEFAKRYYLGCVQYTDEGKQFHTFALSQTSKR